MNAFGTALLLVAAILMSPHVDAANAPATIFPPLTLLNQECGSDQLRIISWAKNSSSTVCLTGQEVLTLAVPNCTDGQRVVKRNGNFICESPSNIPTCGENQYLTFDGAAYACKSEKAPPECAANQVLTAAASGFTCVDRGEGIPACTEGQFLTFNGSTYQCATSKQLALPTCSEDQVLTSDGVVLRCNKVAQQRSRFGGLYELHWPDNGCRYANPLTGGCSCPADYTAHEYRDFIQTGSWEYTDGGKWESGAQNGVIGMICILQ
jgi:hypothetical protein